MNVKLMRVQILLTAVFALVLSVLVPQAFRSAASAEGCSSASTGGEDQVGGLTTAPLEKALRALLPGVTPDTGPFDSSKCDRSKSTDFDSSQATDQDLNGQISYTYNPDGTVWMVDCTADTNSPSTSRILSYCTDLAYQGASPASTRSWVLAFFTNPVEGAEIRQDRAHAHWSLSADNFGGGALTYDINIQSAISA